MPQPVADEDDLVISTPERVAFQYPVAGLGSRFVAQLIDLLVLGLLLTLLTLGAIGLSYAIQDGGIAFLVWDLGAFVIVFGYFLISEAVWSGQTLGKRAVHLRAVGDQGEPLTIGQAVIRNLVRIVDFLPLFYGIGMVVLFANGRGKRLGDLAAGTLVVREHDSVRLIDLETSAGLVPAPATASAGMAAPVAVAAATPSRPSATEEWLRRVDPNLRRLAGLYARRRLELDLGARYQLAATAQPSLRAALPAVVAQWGPLAALDQLANLELGLGADGHPLPGPSPQPGAVAPASPTGAAVAGSEVAEKT